VVGAYEEENLLKPKAYIVLQSGSKPSAFLIEELATFAKGKSPPFKVLRWTEFLTKLPKTATGKIQRFVLRQMLSL
jgi:acyl-coenzyme A synthetase/AMP-(fatty) acid ligase